MPYDRGPHGSHKHRCPQCNWHWTCVCSDPENHHGFCFECQPPERRSVERGPGGIVEGFHDLPPAPTLSEAEVLKRWDLAQEGLQEGR